MNANLLRSEMGIQLRFASSRKETWPGYDESCPLGRRGYWAGRFESHSYLGNCREDAYREWERMVKALKS